MKNTHIGWCHHTVNFWWGCEKVSRACAHCYAETLAKLFSRGRATWGKGGVRWDRQFAALTELRTLNADAAKRGVVERVFINSMSDTFEDREDLRGARGWVFTAGEACRHLQLLLLTKRPENIRWMVPASWLKPGGWPRNVWIGTTVEDQEQANLRIGYLLDLPAPVRFLSMEPLCGPVALRNLRPPGYDESVLSYDCLAGSVIQDGMNEPVFIQERIHWVIPGGESGPKRQEMDLAWLESLVADCVVAGVPVYVKQDSSLHPGQQGRIPDVIWAHKDFPA